MVYIPHAISILCKIVVASFQFRLAST